MENEFDQQSDPQESVEENQGTENVSAEESADDELYVHHTLKADKGQSLMRVDKFLQIHIQNISRSKIKNASMAGCLIVNGKSAKASYKVKPGDEISFLLPWPPPPKVTAEPVDLDIFHEEDNLLIVNKQPGLVVHPGINNWHGTLIHGLLWYLNGGSTEGKERKDIIFPGLIHRIDKDTSGLLVIAKDEYTHDFIGQQFFDHTTERTYVAIVWGNVKSDEGTIRGHIGRSKKDRKQFAVYEDGSVGKHAVTHYKVLERFGFLTLIQCKLETGRTHQIRVHMKHIGHTMFSDEFYDGRRILSGPKGRSHFRAFIKELFEIMPRQALHAKSLGFVHPMTNERVLFESELPDDFQKVLEILRERASDFS